MKILIVENEVYLAQSIASKFMEKGFSCEHVTTTKDALDMREKFDAVLLSTNVSGQHFNPIIDKYKNAIIIMLVAYISNDTVSTPLKLGADDYIVKPFMINELVRKVQHLHEFKKIKNENSVCKKYITNLFNGINRVELDKKKMKYPLVIKTNYQKLADLTIFNFCEKNEIAFDFVSLSSSDSIEKLQEYSSKSLLYVVGLQNLKKNEKSKIYEYIENKQMILTTTDLEEESPYEEMELKSDQKSYDYSEILSIDDYIKQTILNFEGRFPDTELSKRLGMSRKSLWEKRKKYGITKKK